MIKKKNKSLLIIIPARLNSTRLKKKLLRNIIGTPLIIRVAQNAIKTNLAKVLVATDSRQIKKLCDENNIDSLITSKNLKSGTDRIYSAYKMLNKKFDLIVNLQGDLPIFKKELIQKTISLFSNKKTEIGSAVCNLKESEIKDKNIVKAYVKLNKKNEGFAIDFCRSIRKRENFYHHIGIYVYTPQSLEKFVNLDQTKNELNRSLEQMRAMDNKMMIKLIKVDSTPLSIDTKQDLKKIRLLFTKNIY